VSECVCMYVCMIGCVNLRIYVPTRLDNEKKQDELPACFGVS